MEIRRIKPASPLAEEQAARLLVQLGDAIDRATQSLEAVTNLHQVLVELHAALTDPAVELERALRDAREAPPPTQQEVTAIDALGPERRGDVSGQRVKRSARRSTRPAP